MDEPEIWWLRDHLDHPWMKDRVSEVAENIRRLLARVLRDIAARVRTETDRTGVDTWASRRLARLDSDLELFRPFCG